MFAKVTGGPEPREQRGGFLCILTKGFVYFLAAEKCVVAREFPNINHIFIPSSI
jgi:hypothetical protein